MPRSVVVDEEHGNKSIGKPIGSSDVGSSGTDTMDVETDPASTFWNKGTLLHCIVNTVNGILLHGEQEAGGQLGTVGGRIE